MKLRFINILFISVFFLTLGCNKTEVPEHDVLIKKMVSGADVDLRGLHQLNDTVVWVSGMYGTYLITHDGGTHWHLDSVPGAGMLDFRSVWALNPDTAFLVSAGTPARIYKTANGGKSWNIVFSTDNPSVFLDATGFWDQNTGIVMGDPVNGRLYLLKTIDGGDTWRRIPKTKLPPSLLMEGGYAASGTCLEIMGDGFAWLGTGGDSARVYMTNDRGETWTVRTSPLLSGGQMKGIYTLSFKNPQSGIAAGGEWNNPDPTKSRAYTTDGGMTWELGKGVDSYCSGSCHVKGDIFLACGQSGIDISEDNGKTWFHISDEHLYGLAFSEDGRIGFGTGPDGKIVKLSLIGRNEHQ